MHLGHIITLRDQKIQTPRFVILCMVRHLQKKAEFVYVGELTALYSQINRGKGIYSYSAINAMCNRLTEAGLLHKRKEGMYPSYSLTNKAEKLVGPFVHMSWF